MPSPGCPKVARFTAFDLSGRAIHEPAPSAIVRNQHLTLRESVTNYAEVLAQVRGTKWEAEALEEAETSY